MKTIATLAALAALALYALPAHARGFGFHGHCGSYGAPVIVSPVPVTAAALVPAGSLYTPPVVVTQPQVILQAPAPVTVSPAAQPGQPAATACATPGAVRVEALPPATLTYLQTLAPVDRLVFLGRQYGAARAEVIFTRHFGAIAPEVRGAFRERVVRVAPARVIRAR
jgi:hypothetical protein